ncbi:hypothetical protein [Anaerosolibacter sp.]|uniref:hypothetical protein n=1 Tax=Anaerosolibacter sp. TaxID=1872527 RepID=UPI0039EE44A3
MKRKGLILFVSGLLLIGSVTGFSYAEMKSNDEGSVGKFDIQQKIMGTTNRLFRKDIHEDMLKLMKKNGFKEIAKAVEKGDYEAMDEFMNNISDEDYQKMIDIMKNNGYENMAMMMESMDKDQMIQMHNAMGGSEGCHSRASSGMMNNF